MSEDCVFCRIVKGELPSETVYEDDDVLAFRDINPQAPVHVLIIPKRHIPSLADVGPDDTELLGRMLQVAKTLAEKLDIAASGYRVVVNCGRDGGQVVFHLHVHLLGGQLLGRLA
ncbi:MAG: histidine triad nucleotide-binding protein [Firmicutes bacterium]|nr:histidine triad nucleotide-binding protein [Bacillota bacterium]